jgi:hypothetical protein
MKRRISGIRHSGIYYRESWGNSGAVEGEWEKMGDRTRNVGFNG